jgi:hypothetical protein
VLADHPHLFTGQMLRRLQRGSLVGSQASSAEAVGPGFFFPPLASLRRRDCRKA